MSLDWTIIVMSVFSCLFDFLIDLMFYHLFVKTTGGIGGDTTYIYLDSVSALRLAIFLLPVPFTSHGFHIGSLLCWTRNLGCVVQEREGS